MEHEVSEEKFETLAGYTPKTDYKPKFTPKTDGDSKPKYTPRSEGDLKPPSKYFGKPEHQLYTEIEELIIEWNLDGTKTAGNLTRKIIKLIKS